MRTIIKIAVALAIVTATAQAGMVALANYQFEDAMREVLLFAPRATDEEIVEAVMSLAKRDGIPLQAERIVITQVGPDLHVDLTYDTVVPLLPGIYSRVVTFHPSSTVRLLTAGGKR